MTLIPFMKFQGAGNDFVIVDQFEKQWLSPQDEPIINRLCSRRFGVGADGLILLEPSDKADFAMIYFNADGKVGSLCGNGARCAVACMHYLQRFGKEGTFMAYDGKHHARLEEDGTVEITMQPVDSVELNSRYFILDTGSPHYVSFVEDLSDLDIVESGKAIRYSDRFRKEGINVNFVEELEQGIEVNTYERGVEDETLSCGTGVTAAAISYAIKHNQRNGTVNVRTKGGDLRVRFNRTPQGFEDIWLGGPATWVFTGEVEITR